MDLTSNQGNKEHSLSVEHGLEENENNALLPQTPPVLPPVFSMEEIAARRRGQRPEDKKLPKKVRLFYRKQDALINAFERVHLLHSRKDSDNGDGRDVHNSSHEKDETKVGFKSPRIGLYTGLSLFINVCLFIAKGMAAYVSKSMSLVSSVADSALDLVSGILLYCATRAIKRRDPFNYPQGRTRLEPVAIVAVSVFMCSVSFQIISQSIVTGIDDYKCLSNFDSNATICVHEVNMNKESIIIMITTIVLKLILYILCSRETNPTLNILAQDHRNDVLSNSVALVCGFISSEARNQRRGFPMWLVLIDLGGAIIISFYIFITWFRQALQQTKKLTGHTAKPEFIQQITWIAFHHSDSILKIDTVRAFHFGTHFLVEVDIVLPEDMSLKEAHDIGEALQKKIERVSEVERAFVHLDYEFSHKASDEHKVV